MKDTSLQARLGRRIRALRNAHGLSLAQLAHESEPQITRFYLSHIERGRRLPSLEVLNGLAERLDVELFELLIGEEGGLRGRIAELVRQLSVSRQRALRQALRRELDE